MDGHCFGCTEKFGIFRREHGCKKCGFAFCGKCLDNYAVIPGSGPKEVTVCRNCYKQLNMDPSSQEATDNARNNEVYREPPDIFKKRVAALAAKQDTTSATTTASKQSGLSRTQSEDRDIRERLERLKAARQKMRGRTLSIEEIEERLIKLKGGEPSTASDQSQPDYQAPDRRTQHEQSQDLLKQVKEEVQLDAKAEGTELPAGESSGTALAINNESDLKMEITSLIQDAHKQIKRDEEGLQQDVDLALRLAQLGTGQQDDTGSQNESSKMDDGEEEEDIDDKEASQRLIKQLLEEDKLEARLGEVQSAASGTAASKPSAAGISAPEPEELPWCCICNDDATLRCRGCDNDLYCKRCFREGHDNFDLKDHKTSIYRPPRTAKY